MNRIEKMLKNKKKDIDIIEAPDALEERLRSALGDKEMTKTRRSITGKIIAACLVLFLMGYHFDTLAFYGNKLMGYNDVMNGTLKELNELGKGQVIDKSHTFKNGLSITLDGIMIDETQLLAFYTIKAPKGNVDESLPTVTLRGFLGEHMPQSGYGKMDDTKTMMNNIHSFEPPRVLEKTLHMNFRFSQNGRVEEEEITFTVDRQKAMGHTLKANIHKSIKVEQETIDLDAILASPTRTVIKGSIQNILELARDEINNERIRPNTLELKLIANDKELQPQSSGMSTNMKGITFHHEYDALPENLKSLQLKLTRFSADHDVNKEIELTKGIKEQRINVHGQDLMIDKVYEMNGNTYITITTEEGTVLTKVYLLADDKRLELNKTSEDQYEKRKDGQILHRRTLEFKGVGKDYKMDINRMTYVKDYNITIELPIE